jgi:hypothetical protein
MDEGKDNKAKQSNCEIDIQLTLISILLFHPIEKKTDRYKDRKKDGTNL